MPIAADKKLELLRAVYRTFDHYAAQNHQLACAKGCAACCTDHLTATTIEAWALRTALGDLNRPDLLAGLRLAADRPLFRPRVTTNTLAMACLTHQEPPVEEPAAPAGICPLVENDICLVYDSRPMCCRGMFALEPCRTGTESDMPPEMVTIVSICWQIIEHLDTGGLCGNMIDLALLLADEGKAFHYGTGQSLQARGLPPTRPVPGFLVPPDQTREVQGFLERLFGTEVDGVAFRQRLADLRPTKF